MYSSKRKRFSEAKENIQASVIQKLHHDTREIKKAAKKAKTFETRKVVQKLKSARQDAKPDKDVAELEIMLNVLKILDHEAVATKALKTKLNKDKALASNEHVQAAISSELSASNLQPAAPGSPEAKIQARLLSSKLMSTEISSVIQGIHRILNIESENSDSLVRDPKSQPTKRQKLASVSPKGVAKSRSAHSDSGSGSDSDSESSPHRAELSGWESGIVGDDEKELDQGWESGSINDSQDEDEDEDVDMDSPHDKQRSKKPSTKTSTFLPSLAVGFLPGSDDSDMSESELKGGDIQPRKNRRGQRARRLIWAKKFGKEANHKKKEREVNDQRRERQKARLETRQNASHRTNRPSSFQPQSSDLGWGQKGTNPQKPAGTSELHPSWQAKRKLKETQNAAILPATGKKIKFS